MNIKLKKKILVFLLLSLLCAGIDFSRIVRKENPILSFITFYDVWDYNESTYYRINVGPLYYVKIHSGDDSDTHVSESSKVSIGIWFLPSITIYER